MNAAYEHKPKMTFIGFSTIICSNAGYVKCPEFWDAPFFSPKATMEEVTGRMGKYRRSIRCWTNGHYFTIRQHFGRSFITSGC